jgi:FKBP-type peptidyl-prolyl cis-trans isomerase
LVAVRYSIRLAGSSGAVVASSSSDGDVVDVGSGKPLKAFQVALKTMKEGEKAALHINPQCAPQQAPPPPL